MLYLDDLPFDNYPEILESNTYRFDHSLDQQTYSLNQMAIPVQVSSHRIVAYHNSYKLHLRDHRAS